MKERYEDAWDGVLLRDAGLKARARTTTRPQGLAMVESAPMVRT